MGWVTLSLRKMVMTQKVSALEHRLTKLSQEQQSLANSSAYEERIIGINKEEAYNSLMNDYSDNISNIAQGFNNGDADVQDLYEYQVQLQQSNLDYIYNKMMIDSIFTQEEKILQDKVNQKQTYLSLEQEQMETQLEAARAELQQLDQAVSQDIKQSTISLV